MLVFPSPLVRPSVDKRKHKIKRPGEACRAPSPGFFSPEAGASAETAGKVTKYLILDHREVEVVF